MGNSTNEENGAWAQPASGGRGGSFALVALFAGLLALVSVPGFF